ncbi:uncharacterized protein [Lepeophtheirus salmonis]|nr:uncharacterized protein LOC121118431 isoform X1 [Lepeophtheirus salmonis]
MLFNIKVFNKENMEENIKRKRGNRVLLESTSFSSNVIMGQRKSKTRRGSLQRSRPSTPPNTLENILSSTERTEEFKEFLHSLDEECEEETLRVDWLDFLLLSRDLHAVESSSSSAGLKRRLLREIQDIYFVENSSHRLNLSNDALWRECARFQTSSDLRLSPIWKAHDDVLKNLDDISRHFLSMHPLSSPRVHEVISCLL